VPTFRLLKPLPDEINYRGGAKLRLRHYEGTLGGSGYIAEKPGVTGRDAMIVLCRVQPGEQSGYVTDKMARGFAVTEGTPADKLLRSLIPAGYVEIVE
jgi:hypothetical protein